MKKNILILITGIMVFMSSCSKDFLDVNEKNPNSPSVVDPKLVLPAAQNAIAATMNNPRRFDFVYLWHGLWSISAGYSQPQALTQYKPTNSTYQNTFIELYLAGNNLDVIEQQSGDAKNANFRAIAKIMKAYIFQNLVDLYGDVPYTEAFKTVDGNIKPVYDKQKDIYEDLVVQLDEAMNIIETATSEAVEISATSDIIYNGNMELWKKFANTLKLRILINQSGMADRASYISTNIASTAAVGYIGSGESALNSPPYVVSAGKMNPFYETFYNNAGTSQSDGITYYFAGKDVVDFLKATSDPRLRKFFQSYSTTSAAYDGNIFGTPADDLTPQNKTSKLGYIVNDPGTMIGTPTRPAPIFTDFESYFLQAEAAVRGFIAEDAQLLYERAVARSFSYMGLTSADVSTYLTQVSNKANYGAATDKLDIILTQKWVALNGIAPSTIWTDYRRSGYPLGLHFSTDPALDGPGIPPIRTLYPQDEINVNNANVLAVGTIDLWTSKIFWQNR
jgi:hypothetical protein